MSKTALPPVALAVKRQKSTANGRTAGLERPKQSTRNLQSSERLYRQIFEKANDAIIIIEPRREIVLAANRQALRLYGLRRQELIGKSMQTISTDRALGRKRVRETLRLGRLPVFVTQQHRKNKVPLLIEVAASVITYRGRRAILSINRDVTTLRRAESIQHESAQRLRAATDASLDAFIAYESVRDARGRITDFRCIDANPRALEFVNLPREELIGSLLCERFPIVCSGGFFARHVRVVETGVPHEEEFPMDVPYFKAKWVHHQVVKLGDGIASVTRDITARKSMELALRDSEQRLRSAWEANLDACVLYECVRNTRGRIVDFRCIDANRRGLEQANLSRAQLIGSSLREKFPFMQRNGLFARFVRVVNTDVPMREEIPNNGAGQLAQWVSHLVIKVGDGFASITRDITDHKYAEMALKALPRRIIEAQETERRRIARGLHDNVGQLLASALFRLHGLRNQLAAEPPLLFDRIQEIIAYAQSEVRRISHGLRPSELDDLGLAPALRNLMADFRARTGLKVTLRCPAVTAKLPTEIKIGCYRIVQEALTNIERHARAHRVVVRVVRTNGKVRLHIGDDGRGFSQARGKKHPGNSLGLEHMRERAELIGGVFTLGSKRGRGTKIDVCFPSP